MGTNPSFSPDSKPRAGNKAHFFPLEAKHLLQVLGPGHDAVTTAEGAANEQMYRYPRRYLANPASFLVLG